MREHKLSTKEKSGQIISNIEDADKWGIELSVPPETVGTKSYELLLEHDTPDDVVIYCTYKGDYEIRVPGFEIQTGSFSEIIKALNTLLDEISYY